MTLILSNQAQRHMPALLFDCRDLHLRIYAQNFCLAIPKLQRGESLILVSATLVTLKAILLKTRGQLPQGPMHFVPLGISAEAAAFT